MYFSDNGCQIICIKVYLNGFLLMLNYHSTWTTFKLRMRTGVTNTFFRAVRLCRESRPPRDK